MVCLHTSIWEAGRELEPEGAWDAAGTSSADGWAGWRELVDQEAGEPA
jgi:hypothetical protein